MKQVTRTIVVRAECATLEAEESFEATIEHLCSLIELCGDYTVAARLTAINDDQRERVIAELEGALENTDTDRYPHQWWAIFDYLCDIGAQGYEHVPGAGEEVPPKVIDRKIVTAQQILTVDLPIHSDDHEDQPNIVTRMYEVDWPHYTDAPKLRFLNIDTAIAASQTEHGGRIGQIIPHNLYL